MQVKTLKQMLLHMNAIVVRNPVLPILENVMFNNGKMIVTNIQTWGFIDVSDNVPVENTFLLPFRKLKDAVSTLKADDEVEIGSTGILINGDVEFKMAPSGEIKDFPKPPEDGKDKVFPLESAVLTEILKTYAYASNDELRPAMTGVGINSTDVVGTDGHMLRRAKHNVKEIKRSSRFKASGNSGAPFILPNITKILRRVVKTDAKLRFANQNRVWISFGEEITICVRLVDERYPVYENVIPYDLEHTFIVDRKLFTDAIHSADIAANDITHEVRLDFTENTVNVSSHDLDMDTSFATNVPCKGSGIIKIGFNARFILKVLKDDPTGEDTVSIQCNAPNHAAMIDGILVMPVMLNNYV